MVIRILDSSLPFPVSPPCTHHFVCDILDVLQPQFLADDIQVSHRVHIPLYVGHIIILKCPWRNHKAETQIPSSPIYRGTQQELMLRSKFQPIEIFV